jgi:hypothetical protein
MMCSSSRTPVIAFVGHRFVQAVQPMQVSMILYATSLPSGGLRPFVRL